MAPQTFLTKFDLLFDFDFDLISNRFNPHFHHLWFGIRVKIEYGWRRFESDGRRGFTEFYNTVVPSGGWGSGFRASGEGGGCWRSSSRFLGTAPRKGGCHTVVRR